MYASGQVNTARKETGPPELHTTQNSVIKASNHQFSVDDHLVAESLMDPVILVNDVIATAVGTTVTLVTKVTRAGVIQTKRDKQTDRELTLMEYIVADHTGKIRMVPCEDNITPLDLGVTHEVAHAKLASYEGSVYLSAG